jgi:hypothetical protein
MIYHCCGRAVPKETSLEFWELHRQNKAARDHHDAVMEERTQHSESSGKQPERVMAMKNSLEKNFLLDLKINAPWEE